MKQILILFLVVLLILTHAQKVGKVLPKGKVLTKGKVLNPGKGPLGKFPTKGKGPIRGGGGVPIPGSTGGLGSTGLGSTGLGSTGLGSTGLGSTGLGSTGLGSTGHGSTGLGNTGLGSTGAAPGHGHLCLASWANKSIGHLLTTELGIIYSTVSDVDSVVHEVFSLSPSFDFAPVPKLVDAIEALANQLVTINLAPPLMTNPLLYILNWTSGTYIFNTKFTIESVNGQFYTLSQLLTGQYQLVIHTLHTLSGILGFEKGITQIIWSAIPSSGISLQQIYFTIGTLQ